MSKTNLFLYLIIGVFSSGCYSWDIPDLCKDTLPTAISINNGTNVSASLGGRSASWALLNSTSQTVTSSVGTSFIFSTSSLFSGRYTIRATGANNCGQPFDIRSELCLDPVPSTISISGSTTITATFGGRNVSWTLLNSASQSVRTGTGTSFAFTKSAFPSGNYTIRAVGTNSCGQTFEVRSTIVIDNQFVNMITIPGGTFQMGDTRFEGGETERPVRTITVSSFRIGRFEVTQSQWQTVMGNNPSNFPNCPNCPVERVSWLGAVEFCNRLSDREGRQRVYTINGTSVTANWNANGYRLPTEAEWEYAAGGGASNRTRFGNGRDILDASEANFDASAAFKMPYSNVGVFRGRTVDVGSFRQNAFGLQDMVGNVWEWCWDWHGQYPTQSETNPRGPSSGQFRVFRGGSWGSKPDISRVSTRVFNTPTFTGNDNGFRVVTQN